MKTLILLSLLATSISCSHHHIGPKHHHHADSKLISNSEHGKGTYRIEHAGKKYFFETEDEFKKFAASLDEETRSKCRVGKEFMICGE